MKITAIIPEDKNNPKRFLIEATGEELDTIRGAPGGPKVADRYKVGYELKPTATFETASMVRKNMDQVRGLPAELKKIAEAAEKAVQMLEDAK